MRRSVLAGLLLSSGLAYADSHIADFPRVRIDTNFGSLTVELDYERAPISVENFLKYVEDGYYQGTIFHRVINGFVAQGGGYTEDLVEKEPGEMIVNESGNGLSNVRGTIAMARTGEPHSSTSQFYFNLVDNEMLDPTPIRWGYAVFGKVIDGMGVLDKIAHVPTGPGGGFSGDVPLEPVIIEDVVLVNGD